MSDEPLDPIAEERAAIGRILETADGHLLTRHLRRILETVYDAPEAGALLSHNGRRSLARDLMRMIPEGIGSAARPDAQPLAPAGARAVSVARPRGVARRVGPSTQPLARPEPVADGDAA